jgi:hypothetical protein
MDMLSRHLLEAALVCASNEDLQWSAGRKLTRRPGTQKARRTDALPMPLVSPMDGQPGLLGHFDSPHAALHAAQIE